eukprot:TRINITY_DN61962_c0_g1_i1.p1 TRINITY_DN61962_c0_g1~~TRINITY_DN61962_c0_g1_i1.p1  ORF type:complete len:497 (-),score=82.31 TRINITY_DN61962_c0_g1_i1:169-1659(-)
MDARSGGYATSTATAVAADRCGSPSVAEGISTSEQALRQREVDAALLNYVEDAYLQDRPISLGVLKGLIDACKALGGPVWNRRPEDAPSLLHLAVMNEGTPAEELEAVVTLVLESGAPVDAKDEDGDTAIAAVMALAEDADGQGGSASDEEDAYSTREQHMASVRALLRSPDLVVGEKLTSEICSWLRQHMPETGHQRMLHEVEKRAGKELTAKAWCSEQLLAYLERKAYDEKSGIEASVVEDYLTRGASPCHAQNGATALLFSVLNPYSKYDQLERVFRCMLEKEPIVVEKRDGFKLSALQWAADYANVAEQHGLKTPNPATLLALMPCVAALPAGIDAGETCLKVSSEGRCSRSLPHDAPILRFLEGDRVLCRVEAPGGAVAWEEGVIIGLWYRERCWPKAHQGAPYEVSLDLGSRVFALVDHDRIVRRHRAPAASVEGPATLGDEPKISVSRVVKPSGSRFQRRQREDGRWEMLDTVSGRARPCSPPDSDEDD